MTTRILLARHGATVLTAEDRFAGSTDVPLGDEGRTQVRQLAARLATEPITAVYASPMVRTLETARVIADPHRLAVRLSPGLREIDHGHWEGLTRHEAVARYPAEYAAWEARPLHAAPVGGESGLEVLTRARAALDAIVASHLGEHVLVVSHKATIRLLVADLLGLDTNSYRRRLDQQPASLNILDLDADGHAQLVLYNDVSHYGPWHGHTDLDSVSYRPHVDLVADSDRQRIS
jgi:broad specificity phosphatase PhoE